MSTIQNTGGYLTYPNLPFIQLFRNSDTTYTVDTTITGWRVNASSGITESNGVMTVPIAGLYEINISVLSGSTAGVYLNVDNTTINRIGYAQQATGETWSQLVGTILYELNANSTVKFVAANADIRLYGDTSNITVGGAYIRLIG